MIILAQYATNSFGTFTFDELNTAVFRSREAAEKFIINTALDEYPDAFFEDIDSLDEYLIELENEDKPFMVYEITELYPDA